MKITGTIYLYEDSYDNDKQIKDMDNIEKDLLIVKMEMKHGGRCVIVGHNDKEE